MFNIIPLVIILIAIVVIVYIIIRRFPDLSNIRTETILQEKSSQAKKKILDERMKRKTQKAAQKIWSVIGSATQKAGKAVKDAQGRLEEAQKELSKPKKPTAVLTEEDKREQEEYIEQSLEEAEEIAEQVEDKEDFEKAEKRYIDIISADPKNIDAYEGLGDLYYEQRMYDEARETYRYITKLNPKHADAQAWLAEIEREVGNLDAAIGHAQKAVSLQQKNPKFLHLLTELAIVGKDKVLALDAFGRLKAANPENKKLDELSEKIDDLS